MSLFRIENDGILNLNTDKKKIYDSSLRLPLNKHLGQLKLFSNELVFILTYAFTVKNPTIVYVGAGPGHHLKILCKMFPLINFHLYDDHFDKDLYPIRNVKIFKKYFTDDDILLYKDRNDILFISDIRDLSYDSKNWTIEEELKIVKDMDIQKQWVQEIKPEYSMLKFRLPYPEKEFLEYLGKDYVTYLKGIIYIQPWAKITSTETRLVVFKENINTYYNYNIVDHESIMFYHNSITRNLDYTFPLSKYINGFKTKKVVIDTRYDSAFLISSLYEYLSRSTNKNNDEILIMIKKILIKLLSQ